MTKNIDKTDFIMVDKGESDANRWVQLQIEFFFLCIKPR